MFGVFDDEKWEKIYMLPFRCSSNTRIRNFQFKITHNILYLNEKLYIFNKTDTELCYFCNHQKESQNHFFYDCNVVRRFWEEVFLTFHCIFENINIEEHIVLLGIIDEGKQLANLIIILGKQVLYETKMNNGELTINMLKSKIKVIENIEKKIATQKNKMLYHLMKWEKYLNM